MQTITIWLEIWAASAFTLWAGVMVWRWKRKAGPEGFAMLAEQARMEALAKDPARVYEDPIARALLLSATGTFDKAPPQVDPRDELRYWVGRWFRREISPQQLQGEIRRMILANPELAEEKLPPEIKAQLKEGRARNRSRYDGLEVMRDV